MMAAAVRRNLFRFFGDAVMCRFRSFMKHSAVPKQPCGVGKKCLACGSLCVRVSPRL